MPTEADPVAVDPAMVQITGLEVRYGHGRRAARVIPSLDLAIRRGTTMGLVGESGSGKSTLAKVIVGLVAPTAGTVQVDGVNLADGLAAGRARWRKLVQLIPQDPYSSLDPRMTIGVSIAGAIEPRRADVRRHADAVAYWLERVSLSPDMMWRYPHEFSGGQRQRIAVARALAVQPAFIVADEITSALDVSVQAEVLALVAELRAELDLTMLFISHNLAVVHQVCDDVAVMSRGELVEVAPSSELFLNPRNAYTMTLLDSVPGSPGFTLD
ncbi:ATP-binding cassette domain-containing protein [Streptomyces sp. NBC_00075]|uniref:ABC transporter ATP-binding protein n=1 Tax=Streptomyces sp. NBC_00075 TaxID=2975641 RepID=UPI00324FBDDF